MPIVTIQMYRGRSLDQKRRLVRAITNSMVEHASATPDNLIVVIQEVDPDNWATGGQLGIDAGGLPPPSHDPV